MNRLSELISTMKLPIQRTDHFSTPNLMWLVRNSSHKNYDLAVDELKKRIHEKKYDD